MRLGPRVPLLVLVCTFASAAPLFAQAPTYQPPGTAASRDYIVGPSDVLNIKLTDDPALSGRFTVEADLTFTYPLIGRVRAGGLTLRDVAATLERQLLDGGFFKEPQVLVAIEQYKSQKVYVVGEVRTPGAYTLSGDMRLAEALALAGSTLPTASGEAVIVPSGSASGIVASAVSEATSDEIDPGVVRVNLRELQQGMVSRNVPLQPGDTIFVLRADNIYVMGQVKSPGAYPLPDGQTTVLQGLSLAGGVTERGSTGRVQVVRLVDGKPKKSRISLDEVVLPGDTIVVPQRVF